MYSRNNDVSTFLRVMKYYVLFPVNCCYGDAYPVHKNTVGNGCSDTLPGRRGRRPLHRGMII